MKRRHPVKDVYLNIRVTSDLLRRLDTAADRASKDEKRYVSRSALVCALIEDALSRKAEG